LGVVGVFGLLVCESGCAGSAPLLHPAQTLRPGESRAAAGFASHMGTKPDASHPLTVAGARPSATPPTLDAAAVALAEPSGVAPFASLRMGLCPHVEAGVTYDGRGGRFDVRRSFWFHAWSVSAGAGLSGLITPPPARDDFGANLRSARGFGGDVPLLVGWESPNGLYYFWAGARGALERSTVGLSGADAAATRYSAGGLIGVAAGLAPVHVAFELDAMHDWVRATYQGESLHFTGISWTPAMALLWQL
jgi:hypothetical protein